MLLSITIYFLTQQNVVAAVDVFRVIQTAATNLKNNLMIIAAVAAVASIIIGGIFFFFGRRGAENGKTHVGYVLLGVGVILAAASIVFSMFSMFGQTPQGL